MPDLSVIIPARNEEWLGHTVADVLTNRRGKTNVIVVFDGLHERYSLVDHASVVYLDADAISKEPWTSEGRPEPDVIALCLPESIGQRAATNLGAQFTWAKYLMKLDAHCAVAEGFDLELIRTAEELGPEVTQIPAQHNLHIFSRKCNGCGKQEYQGPTDVPCVACGVTDWTRELVWNPKRRRTEFWHFDADLRFQYGAGEYQKSEAAKGDIADVMTSLGACMFMSRDFYWKLGGFDESIGSWGQFGQEWACKTWLSGGRHVTNKRTWFSHCFRTQGHNFGFPYPISGTEQEQVRKRSRELWLNNAWPGQVRPLRWLVEKFWPVQGWSQEQLDALPCFAEPTVQPYAGIVYYSDCQAPEEIAEASRRSIEKANLPIAAVTLKPIDWPAAKNFVLPLERSYLTMFKQILAGLEALNTKYVFFAEHDVIYAPEHWTFMPPRDDVYYYNLNWLKVDAATGKAVTYVSKQTSQLCANRDLLLQHYRKRVAVVERDGFSRKQGFEPGSHNRPERIDDIPSDVWLSAAPNYDIRHGQNLTPSRWSRDQFRSQRNCQGWQESHVNLEEILGVQQACA